MRIGIIGVGFSGRAAARLAVQRGHEVMLSNCRDPATLASGMIRCRVGTSEEAAAFGEVVLLAVPFPTCQDIAPEPLVGKIVLDASNGQAGPMGSEARTSSELVAAHFAGARIVKALNVIQDEDIERHARLAGSSDRRAIPIAGDGDDVKETISGLLDQLGFDVVDAGPLSEGWRFEEGHAAYGVRLDRAGLERALAAAGTRDC
jgi:predicted dinucleotide-binding enzyme